MEKMYGSIKGARRHKNADAATGTKLTRPNHPSGAGGICSICTKDGICEIGKKSRTGQTLFPEPFGIAQFGAEKILPNMDDIQIIPELFGKETLFKKVRTDLILGGFRVAAPLVVSAMGSTKVANDLGEELAIGAAKAGIPMVVGENIIATYGEKGIYKRIKPYLDNFNKKFGAVIIQGNDVDITGGAFNAAKKFGAHGIELKLGQGAKQNLGGEIKFTKEADAIKYKKLGYHIEKNPDGSYQRHTPVSELNPKKLKEKLIHLKKYDLPIWIKISMGAGIIRFLKQIEEIKKKHNIPIHAVTIDGHGGGTGMSPWLIMNETNIPSASVFATIRRKLSFDLILAGGYSDGMDIGKAIMLGASGIAMGRSFLIAANAKKHAPTLQQQIEINKGDGIKNFVSAIKEELKLLCAVQRVNSISELRKKRKNLLALSKDAGMFFGINSDIRKTIQ